jgi:hypothetical protein
MILLCAGPPHQHDRHEQHIAIMGLFMPWRERSPAFQIARWGRGFTGDRLSSGFFLRATDAALTSSFQK